MGIIMGPSAARLTVPISHFEVFPVPFWNSCSHSSGIYVDCGSGWPWETRSWQVKRAEHHVTTGKGGESALREVAELSLKAQGKWKRATLLAIG